MSLDLSQLTFSKPARVYEEIELWKPVSNISLSLILDYFSSQTVGDNLLELISFLCRLNQEEDFPRRLNGEEYLAHPLNVAHYLQRAKAEPLAVAAGMVHDFLEDSVDQHRQKCQIHGPGEAKILDAYETKVVGNLEQKINGFCEEHSLGPASAQMIMKIIGNLTRHKRHKYYRSISEIFHETNPKIKEMSIQVKLADRLHNILCLGNFIDEKKIFECFKNLFILNNVKRYLIENGQITKRDVLYSAPENVTEKLFHKCCKATFFACLNIYHRGIKQGLETIESDLQLYFEDYNLRINGLWGVNEWDSKQEHPSKLFNGIIRKYDARIHDQAEEFQRRQETEIKFCQELFAKHYFNSQQTLAIIQSKDAYAFKTVAAKLLYDDDYLLEQFECSNLCHRNRQCLKD